MRFLVNEEDMFERYNFKPVSTDVTMFNEDNELILLTEPYIETSNFALYVDGERYGKEINTTTYLFGLLKSFGFGEDYEVVWSMFVAKAKDNDNLKADAVIISINTKE